MGVIVSNRSESKVQFVATAEELLKYTIHKCLLLPKRLTFFVSSRVATVAQELFRRVIRIRDLYEEKYLEERIKLCKECIADLDFLSSELDIIKLYTGEKIPEFNLDGKNKNHINMCQFATWSRLIDTEIKLIKGLIDKDLKRLEEYCE